MDGEKPSRGRRQSPQEAKRLSLAHDRRNSYGENDKASRKAIPRFKAASNRSGRHGVKQALTGAHGAFGEADETRLVKAARKSSHPEKTKGADEPLGKVIAAKVQKRERREGGKAKRAAKRMVR